MTALIQIPANDIHLEGMAVTAQLPRAWLDAELADAGVRARADGALSGRLSRSGNDVVVRCRVTVAVEADCVRCLGPARFELAAELSLLLQPAPKAAVKAAAKARARREPSEEPPEYEFDSGEADVDTYDGETVVLDPFVREALLLEMPSFPLCSEACPGIGSSPESGERPETAAAVDPRLAPLGVFRKQMGPATLDDLVAAAAERSAAAGRPVMRSNSHRAKRKKK